MIIKIKRPSYLSYKNSYLAYVDLVVVLMMIMTLLGVLVKYAVF